MYRALIMMIMTTALLYDMLMTQTLRMPRFLA